MLTAWLARLSLPLVWRTPRQRARKLYQFAAAELGSHIDLMQAAEACPQHATVFVQHALDESRHAQMFAKRAHELMRESKRTPHATPRADSEGLFDHLGLNRFIAFVHLGERRGRIQFEVYERWLRERDSKTAHVLARILEDERHHEAYSAALLETLAPNAQRATLRQMQLWELGRRWLRAGRALSSAVFGVGMLALYVVLAPWGVVMRWRARRGGWQENT